MIDDDDDVDDYDPIDDKAISWPFQVCHHQNIIVVGRRPSIGRRSSSIDDDHKLEQLLLMAIAQHI